MNIFTKLFGVRGLRIVMCAAVIALVMSACDTGVGGGNGNDNGDSDPFEGTWYGFMQEDEGQVWLKIVAKDGKWTQQMYMGTWGNAADGTYSVSGNSVTITIANAMGIPYNDLPDAGKEQVGPQIQTVTISSKTFTQRGIEFTQTVPDFDKPLNPDDLFEGTWYGFNEDRDLWLKFDAADDKWTQQMYMGMETWEDVADGTYSISGDSVTITIVNAMGIPYNELTDEMKAQTGPQTQTTTISSSSFILNEMEFTHTEPVFVDPVTPDPFAGQWYSSEEYMEANLPVMISAEEGHWSEFMYTGEEWGQEIATGTYTIDSEGIVNTIVEEGRDLFVQGQEAVFIAYDELSQEMKNLIIPNDNNFSVDPDGFDSAGKKFTNEAPTIGGGNPDEAI